MIKNVAFAAISASLVLMATICAEAQPTLQKAPPAMPRMCPYNINNGASIATSRDVILNCDTTTTSATQYRASERSDFTGAAWLVLRSSIPFTLSPADGMKTVYFQIRNARGTATGVVSKSIMLQTRKDFTLKAAYFLCAKFPEMNPAWYSCKITDGEGSPGDCTCTGDGAILVKTTGYLFFGAKAEYEFFGGRLLNEGWSFVSLSYTGAECLGGGVGAVILKMPQAGSRDIMFKIRLWADMYNSCTFRINSVTIRGPSDKSVTEAFR